MAITMDGIYVNGQKVTFRPEDILSGDASTYTEEIGTAVEEWLEENVTGGEQVTDTTLTLPGVPADAEVTGNKIEELKEDLNDISSHMPVSNVTLDPSAYTAVQYWISPSTSHWSGSAKARSVFIPISANRVTITASNDHGVFVALLKSNGHTAGDTPDYATGYSAQVTFAAGTTQVLDVPNDANYLYVCKSFDGVVYTPASIVAGTDLDVPTVDASLSVSGKAADAKVTGDDIKAINDKIGVQVQKSFTKPDSGNAVTNFAFAVRAGQKISVFWTGETVTRTSSLNLYTRATASGDNVETLYKTLKANELVEVTPTVDASYLRVVATASGTIYLLNAGTILDDVSTLKNSVEKLSENVSKIQTPFVEFSFTDIMYDPSAIFAQDGEIGVISDWPSKTEALEKVHAAFDALIASGGAGYGFGERITALYKESASDEAQFDILAPSYVVNGVSEGETVMLNIGTDTNGDPVTYEYTYESNTEPYEVRLYKFHGTNSALHTNSVDIPKKKMLIVGGTHGNEFCAPINLYVFAKHLCSDYSNPDMLKLRSAFDVYIVPYLNGFGCQYQWNNGGSMSVGSRSNGHMVDINRNCYTAGWSGATGTAEQITASFESKIANLATNTFAGASNGSEFESQLVKALIEWIQPNVFIDHHNNSGNNPFYVTCRGSYAGNLVYQAANDSAYARLHNMSQYYGSKYNLFLGSDVSPATKASINGHMQTMAYELGVRMNAVCEMPEAIAYLNGVIDSTTKTATKYSADAFKQAEYTLLNLMLHLGQYAMEN